MGKVLGGILGTLAIVVLVLFLLLHFGLLSWGNNSGNGDGDRKTVIEDSATVEESEELIITIVVTQDKYFIDDQEVTLTQINEKVTDESAIIKVVLENNYASAKAWDDIKSSLTEWGVIPIEQ